MRFLKSCPFFVFKTPNIGSRKFLINNPYLCANKLKKQAYEADREQQETGLETSKEEWRTPNIGSQKVLKKELYLCSSKFEIITFLTSH